jgi:hypothetical protein
MKKYFSIAIFGLFMASVFTSCQNDEVAEPATPVVEKQLTKYEQIAAFIAQQPQLKSSMGNGAMFVEPISGGLSFGVINDLEFEIDDDGNFIITGGEIGVFDAAYGANDFWLEMPDGTIKVKLVSNQANGFHIDFGTGVEHSGTGNCNFNFRGELVTIEVPFPPFELTFLLINDASAFSIHGHAKVTENGEPGPSKNLRLKWLMTPGGQGQTELSLN